MRKTNEKFRVHLTDQQRQELEIVCRQQRCPAAKLRRAQDSAVGR